jgi:hypothetical protein
MLGPNPTQERFRLAAYYLTDLAFQASGDEPLAGGSSWSGTPQCTLVDIPASRTTRGWPTSSASVRPVLPLGLRRLGGHRPRDATTPRGSATCAWPLCRAALNQSRLRATTTPTPSDGLDSMNSRRRDASSTRSWPFYTKSSTWMLSPAIDALLRTYLYRGPP